MKSPWGELQELKGASTAQEEENGVRQAFSNDVLERYSRQMLLLRFGVEGQKRLSQKSVLVIGAGGLGCPAAMYLASAGVGRLGLLDRGDSVDRSNLHRQIGHTDASVGADKCLSLRDSLMRINPGSSICTLSTGITAKFALQLILPFDIVLDCTDNVESRYIISDACAALRKPLVSGSAIGFEGQLSVYCDSEESPCYRCIFPSPPPPDCVGSCDTAGVLGPVPGVIGTMQAVEALKLAAEIEGAEVCSRRMVLYDGLSCETRVIRLRSRSKTCRACGNPEDSSQRIVNPAEFDYGSFTLAGSCATPQSTDQGRLRATALLDKGRLKDALCIDVRPKEQFDMCSIGGFQNIPITKLSKELITIQNRVGDKEIILICRRGVDSATAVSMMRKAGIENATDVIGGLDAWRQECNPEFPTY
ncbi:hypothetical protein NDN08_001216 [Rhodosorus marinus]|uniref:Adenylyltransferase and sulfurtransferase MOCS3 homolog n=1 Tax=Rhodosorus marinus TaxID=101924 RepID=A0AAV8UQA6_9RHOD|nr:hypothetical protein NDN08_001216 [Rhodosorus marinus]